MKKIHQSSQVQLQALLDLNQRAKAGIYIYLAIWIVFVFAFDFMALDKHFVYVNTVLIVIISSVRIVLCYLARKATRDNSLTYYSLLVTSVLASALHWGVLTAWLLMRDNLSIASHLMLIVLPAFAMGGASTLCISNTLRIFYPLALYLPPLSIFFYLSDPHSLVYALSILLSYLYILASSRYSRENFWSAISSQIIAEERAKELEKISVTDQLTKLKNRMYFDNEFSKEWQRAHRLKSQISLLIVDFDHFKNINDSYGHLVGDEVLSRSASLISNEITRPTDCVARYGGEEFVIILPSTDANGAKVIAERVRKSIQNMEIQNNDSVIKVTCSVGSSTVIPKANMDKMQLIKDADNALYKAKNSGRNCCVVSQLE